MSNANLSAPEAERAVIGSMLIEKEAISAVIDLIQPEHFAEAQNAAIVRAIYGLFKENRPADIVSVVEAGKAAGLEFPSLGAYLAESVDRVTTAGHVTHHARTVLDRYYKRATIQAATQLVTDLYSEEKTDASLKALQEVLLKKEAVYAPAAFTYANGLFDIIEAVGAKSKKTLYRTGYNSLDGAWHGVGEGEVITIGAATNVGKSMLCLNLMHNMASRGVKCLYVGTEMSSLETTTRHLSIASGVSAYKLRIGQINLEDHGKIHSAISDKLYKMNVTMIDNPSPSVSEINSAIINSGCKVVFVDYLGRLGMVKAENYRLRVHETMIALKTMARTRNVVVFLAAQLGRTVYGQGSPKPTLADLSESKSIEAESDKVLLGWIDPAKQTGTGTVLSFINAKNRQGKRGTEWDMTLDANTLAIRENTGEVFN